MKRNGWLFAAVGVIILLIFAQSIKPGDLSAGESNRVVLWLTRLREPVAAWGGFFSEILVPVFDFFIRYVRKIAHFTEYAVLGFFSGMLFGRLQRFLPGVLLGVAVAAADECIQLFVPGRNGSLWDVALDCLGYMVCCLPVLLIYRRRAAGEQDPD